MNKNYILGALFLVMVTIGWLQMPSIVHNVKLLKGEKVDSDKNVFLKDTELAKIILSPTKKELEISRDPFQPLDYGEQKTTEQQPVAPKIDMTPQVKADVKFLGVVVVKGEFRAALSVKGHRGILKIGDEVLKYKIASIEKDKVALSNGQETITIKRGDE